MSDETFMRLAAPRKKGILALVFSRFLIVGILLVLQVLLYVLVFTWLYDYFAHFYILMSLFTLIVVLYLFSSDMDASAKLTWLLLMSFLPFVGGFLLVYTQTNIGHIALKKRAEQLIEETKDALPQSKRVMDRLKKEPEDVEGIVKYLRHSGCFPIHDDTAVTYFSQGEQKFAAMLEELEKAKSFIFMEYFIIEEGYMWGKILEILIRKAAEGVDVRVMYDGMCEMSTLPADYWRLLQEKGIHAKAFAPIKPALSSHYNYRDHRKILVIDGRTAFTGGVNLADEYINRKERFGHWKDTAVMLKGGAVDNFTLCFLQMWNIDEKETQYEAFLRQEKFPPRPGEGYVMPYGDCPLDNDKVGEMVYMDILNQAKDYVHIMTPYLIIDGEMEAALKFAAERGVDVKLILPGIPDKKLPYALAKSHYKVLTEAGVKIYEYTPGFVHAKVFVCDNVEAVVGTINLDYRSLYHHFECAAYMYRVPCIREIEADFQETLAKCRRITKKSIREEKMSYRMAGFVMKFIAPLM